jgi:hypothetical protein
MKLAACVLFVFLTIGCTTEQNQLSVEPTARPSTTTTTIRTTTTSAKPTLSTSTTEDAPTTTVNDAPRRYFAELPELQPHPETPVLDYPPNPLPTRATDLANLLVERHEAYNPLFAARFLSTPDMNSRGLTDIDFLQLLPSHPAITYTYECPDGRPAYVTHFAHADPAFINSWQREDYLGDLTTNTAGETTFVRPLDIDPPTVYRGVLHPTKLGGPLAGADYIHRIEDGDTPFSAQNWIRYGHYQYFTFTDGAIIVDVLVQAPSMDHRDERAPEDTPTITTDSVEPLVLVDHERVQARFDCGHELSELIATAIQRLGLGSDG